jgi:hypothetical protein
MGVGKIHGPDTSPGSGIEHPLQRLTILSSRTNVEFVVECQEEHMVLHVCNKLALPAGRSKAF